MVLSMRWLVRFLFAGRFINGESLRYAMICQSGLKFFVALLKG